MTTKAKLLFPDYSPANYSPASGNVDGHLEGIDDALSGTWVSETVVLPTIGAVARNPGVPKVAKVEGPTLTPSGSYTALDIDGAGYISHIMMSCNSSDTNGRNKTRMKVYVNGEVTPSIDVSLEDMCCSRGLDPNVIDAGQEYQFATEKIGYVANAFGTGTGFYAYLTIPFQTHITVVFENGSSTANTILGGHLDYRLVDREWGRYSVLRNVNIENVSVAAYNEQLLLDFVGRGAFYASYLHFAGGDSNYNYLEGNIKFYVDGDYANYPGGASDNEYDSSEDYFNFSWYFWGGNTVPKILSTFCGCPLKDDNATVSAYRYHDPDMLAFETGVRMTWANGEVVSGAPVSNNTVVNGTLWYYSEA